jgi:hypothetical protein
MKELHMEIKPQAMAFPQDPSTLPQGKYGPVFPKTPACYGFTIIAKIIPAANRFFTNMQRISRRQWPRHRII